MKDMAALAHERGVNRKMTSAIKGFQCSLDQVEVPLHDWHYYNYAKEIYRYGKGVFEAHVAYTSQNFPPTYPSNNFLSLSPPQSSSSRYHPGRC